MVGGGMLNLLARSVGHLQDAVIITQGERGPDGVRRIIFVNRAFAEMTGFAESEVVGNTPDITIGPETDRAALMKIQRARDELRPVREHDLRLTPRRERDDHVEPILYLVERDHARLRRRRERLDRGVEQRDDAAVLDEER